MGYTLVNRKNYSSIIVNVVSLFDKLIKPDAFPYRTQLLKYGTFMATVAQAQNSDEVKAAIEAVALPAGSSRIKRESAFNVSLNAYLGGFYGWEHLKNPENSQITTKSSAGVWGPIGITASWGLRCKNTELGSLSLYGSIIDIGALASFRLNDDSTKTLPEFTWQNLLAPGGYLVYGLPKLPISIGGGFQVGPQLRKITANNTEIDSKSAWRFQLFISVDIPLLNFYTASRRR